jgi:hypothetical protein
VNVVAVLAAPLSVVPIYIALCLTRDEGGAGAARAEGVGTP